ncbi:MAG: hypothetical protein II567_09710 [Candidatus Riflebacteria bacterium]|nr:hypothetical protein [Candidatus Riflebacteria bacterium]
MREDIFLAFLGREVDRKLHPERYRKVEEKPWSLLTKEEKTERLNFCLLFGSSFFIIWSMFLKHGVFLYHRGFFLIPLWISSFLFWRYLRLLNVLIVLMDICFIILCYYYGY